MWPFKRKPSNRCHHVWGPYGEVKFFSDTNKPFQWRKCLECGMKEIGRVRYTWQ